MKEKLELYVHIPFCVRKCAYCDFLSAPADAKQRQEYVDALLLEIESYRGQCADSYEIPTVFVGGGTPSLLEPEQIIQIFGRLRQVFSFSPEAEITIEVNPGTVTEEKLAAWKRAGINRISIGLQSVNDDELRWLGRIHTYGQFEKTYHMVRAAGFENVNLDLISAIPGQTVESWRRTLEKVAALAPEHISAYSLIVEEGTPFYEIYAEHSRGEKQSGMEILPLPDEDAEREMYHLTEQILSGYGYQRYEISNYAKEGFACQHNQGYWERVPYLGIGLGASSLVGHKRWHNVSDFSLYIEKVRNGESAQTAQMPGTETAKREYAYSRPWQEEIEDLTTEDEIEEYLFLGLREMKGISVCAFKETFGRDIFNIYGKQLKKLVQDGLMETEGDRIRLSSRGIDVSNRVFVEFLDPKFE